MLIELELNTNDTESWLRHCTGYQPSSGDCREDSRLSDALDTLASAIRDAMNEKTQSEGSKEMIDPKLLAAAIGLFGNQALAIGWLSKPLRALDDRRPIDVHIEEALTLIMRLEHGISF